MHLPKTRNLLIGVLIVAVVVGAGLFIAQDQETLRVRSPLGVDDPQFPDYRARLLGRPITSGDAYKILENGTRTFPAMLAAIDGAKRRISFETYVYGTGTVPAQFTRALSAAAARGVRVRIVLDSVGASKIDDADIRALEGAGCEIGGFNPIRPYTLEDINYRTHRKILVIDGHTAFVGGIGIDDQWSGNAEDKDHWRDTHFRVRGPAVDNIEAAFHENWIETGGVVAPEVEPRTGPPAGGDRSIAVWSSPEGGANALKLAYLLAIGAARKTVDIQSPYLITDESTQWSLAEARRRGVRVRLLMEGDITDAKPVKFASRGDYATLMAQGIEVYEYQPTMMHVKAMVVDVAVSIVGSANFDNRSLELNDENNVIIAGRDLAERLTADFEQDLRRSKRLNLDEWRGRPIHIRAREKGWNLFGELF